jgi:Ca2+:H+ antiporter
MPSSLVGAPSLHRAPHVTDWRGGTELLVDVVDVVLNGSGIDEKFLGVTLFALVPNTTEFMNAVSFAMNGNIALRYPAIVSFFMVLGLSGVHTVWKSVQHMHFKCVFYRSPRWSPFRPGTTPSRWAKSRTLLRVYSLPLPKFGFPSSKRRFRLIFPRWDVIVIILSIFLLTYTYIEAKANYHRGSILVLRCAVSVI